MQEKILQIFEYLTSTEPIVSVPDQYGECVQTLGLYICWVTSSRHPSGIHIFNRGLPNWVHYI